MFFLLVTEPYLFPSITSTIHETFIELFWFPIRIEIKLSHIYFLIDILYIRYGLFGSI